MSRFEDALAEYVDAVHVEFQHETAGAIPHHIKARRIAATVELHASTDPWRDCLCVDCLVSRETMRD